MNQTQTTALTATNKNSSNTAIALRNAWQQEWLTAYNALPVKAGMTSMEVCALREIAPSVSIMNSGATDTQAGIDVFMAEVVRICRFADIQLDDFQLETTAEILFGEYYHWTFAELKHFTQRVLKTEFKCQKEFGKMGTRHIMLCASEHADAVMQARIDYNQHHNNKPATNGNDDGEEAKPYLSAEEIEEGLAAWQAYRQQLLDRIHAERDAEEARQREADRLRDEKMMRLYCEREGLDYEEMKREVG